MGTNDVLGGFNHPLQSDQMEGFPDFAVYF